MSYSLRLFVLTCLCFLVLTFALPASAGRQVPFKTDAALVSQPAPSNEGCPAGAVRFNVSGPGIASHMGKITVSEYSCLQPDLTFVAYFTMTAANGDTISGSAAGYGVPTSPTTFTIHGSWTISGGTGRFSGESGSGTAIGEIDLVTGASPHHLEGTISTVGSN